MAVSVGKWEITSTKARFIRSICTFIRCSKVWGCNFETESSGILGMGCTPKNAFLAGTKPCFGSPRATSTFSIWIPFACPRNTRARGITRARRKACPSGNPLGKNPSDFWDLLQSEFDDCVWDIPNVKSNHLEKIAEHPCQFPVELVERCVLSMTCEDDWVLDPYGGVGSAAIATLKHNRRAVSIDRDALFCAIARKRIVDFYEGKLKIRPMGKPVHKPSGNERVSQVPIDWEHLTTDH